jgi:hypothetical protein
MNRRLDDDKSRNEIIRYLKHYIARELFPIISKPITTNKLTKRPQTTLRPLDIHRGIGLKDLPDAAKAPGLLLTSNYRDRITAATNKP